MLDLHQEYVQLLKLIRRYIEQETGVRILSPILARSVASAGGATSARGAASMAAHVREEIAPLSSGRKRQPLVAAVVKGEEPLDNLDIDTLEEIEESIQGCKRCHLAQYRKNIVFGIGNPEARLMIIGEAPGAQEDIKGQPFVGDAGQLLTKMLAAIHIERKDVYITNVVKCRPENNKNPNHDEIVACNAYLIAQIRVIKPKIILCLGNFAAKTLLKTENGISTLRGKFFDYQGIKLLPTYHPAALLYHPAWKKDAWIDLQLLQKELEGGRSC
ncbi:MAG: uracil-DNA glycosylase [bacterium]|nr:uracil-DNA glycosylase [bacterium]